MDNPSRGRQSMQGQLNSINRSRSPSAQHVGFNQHANALGLDPSLTASQASFANPTYNTAQQQQQQQRQQHLQQQQQQQQQQFDTPNPSAFASNLQSSAYLAPGDLSSDTFGTNFDSIDPTTIDFSSQVFESSGLLDPAVLGGSQPNEARYMNSNNEENMATTMNPQASQHPGMLSAELVSAEQQQFGNGIQHNTFNQPMHSRNSSLDPSSAAFMGRNNGDWSGMQFHNHRHTASDQYSDVSSSAMPSPYLGNDSFDPTPNSNSPLLQGQDSSLFNEGLGLEQFSLGESQQRQHISPGHSPHMSPNVSPQHQQQVPLFSSAEQLGFTNLGEHYSNGPGPDVDRSPDAFPVIPQQDQHGRESMTSFAGTMSPPEINIEPALETQTTANEPPRRSPHSNDALSPPLRSPSRMGRQRAISDSHVNPSSSRSTSPMRPRSPSLGIRPGGSLSPQHSRSASPSGGIQKPRRPSMPENRHWAIGLAERGQANVAGLSSDGPTQSQSPYMQNPNSATASTGTDSNRRVQKHPATFQCHLCPKRFTRAYNLRSHLRTHTDERPFVCTVCNKAFARQHDRKRHEGLHSGEKKFVCKGLLQSAINSGRTGHGQTWGCGRRFARADALGRHFRSEAGRACIRPLLEEEAQERRAAMIEQANQDMLNNGNALQTIPAPEIALDSATFTEMALPAALLQQYPALADIQWNAIPGPSHEDDYGGDVSGRSSFDASSGGEQDYPFDDEGDGGYVSGPGAMDGSSTYNSNRLNADWSLHQNGWSSDYEGKA